MPVWRSVLVGASVLLAWFCFFDSYALVYLPLKGGDPSRARRMALPLGILSLFFGGIVSGVLLLVARRKLKAVQVAWA